MLKMAVLAPIPSASTRIVATAKPGALVKVRIACFTSSGSMTVYTSECTKHDFLHRTCRNSVIGIGWLSSALLVSKPSFDALEAGMTRYVVGPLLVLVFVFGAAVSSRPGRNTLKLPATAYRYANVALPAHFTQPFRNLDNTPPDNPLTDAGATLGRVLFYDTRLSANNTTSCGSCHVQAHAFADPKPLSVGLHGARTDRRAMPLVNVRYYQRARFFWDERAGNLEHAVLLPIQSRIEMGHDLKLVVDTLGRDRIYRSLFTRAFGDPQVTEQRMAKALAQFVRSIVSYRSRYDEGRGRARSAQEDFDNFTLQENRGKALFMRNCSSCHMKDGNEHFVVPTPANTGLRGEDATADGGVGDVTLRAADLGSFKSPSLRNVEVTAPYGHDGRFATLEALIDHYSENAILGPNLGYFAPVGPLKFTASEKAALIAFLKTLTDERLLTDPRFSNPFVNTRDVPRGVSRTMRTAATLGALAAMTAQAPGMLRSAVLITEIPAPPPPPQAVSADVVIKRVVSFDRDGNRRISREELPERMQGLVARGDRNADAALDLDEIGALVNVAASETTRVAVRPQPSEGLPGVVKDLRLAPDKQARALAIVGPLTLLPHVRGTSGDVYEQMKALLDDEEYENFLAAAERLKRSPRRIKQSHCC
jgi:cytochrome c peroxidase